MRFGCVETEFDSRRPDHREGRAHELLHVRPESKGGVMFRRNRRAGVENSYERSELEIRDRFPACRQAGRRPDKSVYRRTACVTR